MQLSQKIAQYLDGEMSEQEAAAFENEIKTNPELAEEVQLHQLAVKGIQQKGDSEFQDFKTRMKTLENTKQETPVIPLKTNRSNIMRWLSVAAVLLLVVGGYFLWPQTELNPMVALSTQLIAFNESGTKGSDPANANPVLAQGIKHFKDKDYTSAISSFDQVIKDNLNKRATAQFLKADALYQLGKTKQANALLQQILQSDNENIYEKAQGILKQL